MAQLTSKWQPLEWQCSPFNFAHRGAIHAQWIYCREFAVPPWIMDATHDGVLPLDQISNGSEISKSTGDLIFETLRDSQIDDRPNVMRR